MKTEVYIYNLNGNRAAVRDYANTIASMSASNCNAYVMAFDKDNEILWTVQAGDDLDEVKAAINWQGVRRVEIYDHSADGTYKMEHVYITSRISLNEYTSERSASEFVVVGNTTQYTADNWQKAEADESDNSDGNSDGNNEGKQTAAEPSRLAQAAAKIAASMKIITATPQTITAAVVRALAQSLTLAAIYCAQRTAAALRTAHRATIAARVWLRASHEFYAQDGDPIKCTGWQFVGYNIAAAVVAVLLSIKY